MLTLEVSPVPDWFMMEYPVSECSNAVEAFGEILSDSDMAGHIGDNRFQQPWPEYFLVSYIKQACPKTEGEFRDDSTSVKRLIAFDKSIFCFQNLVDFLWVQYSGQVKPCIGFEIYRRGIVNTVSEADFQTLQRGI